MSRLFQLGDDSFHYLLSWLDLVCVSKLDTAIGNKDERSLWLYSLYTMDSKAVDEYGHSHSSIRWLIRRGARATRIRIRHRNIEWNRITDETFAGVGILSSQGTHTDYIDCTLNTGCANTSMSRITKSHRSENHNFTTDPDPYSSVRPRSRQNLTSIDLSNCRNISHGGLSAIAEGCHDLTWIDLGHCESMSDEGLSAIAEGCHHLRSINLRSCHISDISLSAIAQFCHHLTSINLSNCDGISDEGLSAIAEGCHHLTSINLTHCIGISDISLSAIAEGCHNLTSINLGHCVSISVEGLSAIAEGCLNLTSINLSRSPNISKSYISSFKKRYPRLGVKLER